VNLSIAANAKIVTTISSHQGTTGKKTATACAVTSAANATAHAQVIRRLMLRKNGVCQYYSATLSRAYCKVKGRPIASETITIASKPASTASRTAMTVHFQCSAAVKMTSVCKNQDGAGFQDFQRAATPPVSTDNQHGDNQGCP
jgi:hypothetical protein